MKLFLIILCLILKQLDSFKYYNEKIIRSLPLHGHISKHNWNNNIKCKVLGPSIVFEHMGDHNVVDNNNDNTDYEYNMNVGKAIDVLKRQLPIVFYGNNLDFSIFAPQITVVDQRQNKMVMQKSFYSTAVKSLRMAATISSIYPSMNVRKVEYIEDCCSIEALVDVVLPDTMKIEGQSVWEGMFYFGLDRNGKIDTHIFDRKISNYKPAKPKTAAAYPWLRQEGPQWTPDLVKAVGVEALSSEQDDCRFTTTIPTLAERIFASVLDFDRYQAIDEESH